MIRTFSTNLIAVLLIGAAAHRASAATPASPAVEAMLIQGKIADAQRQLEAQLKSDPRDDNARFALGIVQTLRGGERLMQGLYRYGMQPAWATMLPIVRLPVPENPQPEPLTNEAFRQLIADLVADLGRAETTLALIESKEVKLPLHLGMYRLDFNDDGMTTDDETLWQIFSRVTRRAVDEQVATQFVVAFDKGDVHWLRGYCHLLSSLCELFLAYDTQELHDYAAQLFFPTAKTPYPQLHDQKMVGWFMDAVAFIHMLRLPVKDADRLASAHAHLLLVVEQSRLSWEAILAETDDELEWVPNPRQRNTAIPGALISQDMVKAWHELLDELEAILLGRKLIPFWRGGESRGINMRRVFFEPTTFDLVLWVQGSTAIGYLEDGPLTEPGFWRRVQDRFQGQFFWFALWVN
jgi:hypothetical protein